MLKNSSYGRVEASMKEKLLNNAGIKIISVLFAIMLWLLVVNTEDPIVTRDFKDIKVQVINEEEISEIDKVYEIVEGSTVNITVEGRRTVVDQLTSSDFIATADLGKLSDVYAVKIQVLPIKSSLKDEIVITCNGNDTLKVKLEEKETKQVPVTIITQGTPASGYAVGSDKVIVKSPNIIEVTGAQSLVKKVKEARIYVNVNNVYKDFEVVCTPILVDSDGDEVAGAERLKVSADSVTISMKIFKTKEVAVEVDYIGNVQDGYVVDSVEYEPKTILVAGMEEDLKQISKIEIKDIDVSDLSGDFEPSIDISDYLPDGVYPVDSATVINVAVKIRKASEKVFEFTQDDILLQNANEKYSYRIKEQKFTLRVLGNDKTLSELTLSDLSPYIDCTVLSESQDNIVPIQLKEVDGVKIKTSINAVLTVEQKK